MRPAGARWSRRCRSPRPPRAPAGSSSRRTRRPRRRSATGPSSCPSPSSPSTPRASSRPRSWRARVWERASPERRDRRRRGHRRVGRAGRPPAGRRHPRRGRSRSPGGGRRRRAGPPGRGVDRDPGAAAAVDQLTDLASALEGAGVAVVATPLGILPAPLDAVVEAAPADCVVTDVGSAKRVAMRDDERFVGGHPLAGSERAGAGHAREDLFDGATWYLTPTPRSSGVLYERLHRFVGALGARPAAIDADLHDRLMATISHLPHVVANLLVEQATALGEPAIGPSFRDATRVAGANPPLWADILLANRDALAGRLRAAPARREEVRAALARGAREALERWQAEAAQGREALLEA